MNKFRVLTIVAVLLLLINAGTLAYLLMENRQDRPKAERGEAPASFIIEVLNLDATQQEQFRQIREEHQGIVRQARDEDRRLHDQYFSLLKTDNPDKIKADSISALIAKQRGTIEAATFEHFEKLRKICKADQKEKFDQTIDEIAKRFGPKGPPPHEPPMPR